MEMKYPKIIAIPPILTKDFFFCFLGLGVSIMKEPRHIKALVQHSQKDAILEPKTSLS